MKPAAPKAANTNFPLWKQAVYRVIETREPASLGPSEREALLAHAIAVMKPDTAEQASLALDARKQNEFMLLFSRAFSSGIPPWSGISERIVHIPE